MKFLALIGATLLASALAACGDSGGDSTTTSNADGSAGVATTTAKLLKPKAKPLLVPPKGPPPKEMVAKDLRVGTGAAVEAGDKLTVEYTGFNYVNHEEFTNHAHTWDKGEPLVFTIGAGEVIPGVDRGVIGMKIGGRRELTIPSDLAYGNVSPPPEVGPNEAVVYYVELLGVG